MALHLRPLRAWGFARVIFISYIKRMFSNHKNDPKTSSFLWAQTISTCKVDISRCSFMHISCHHTVPAHPRRPTHRVNAFFEWFLFKEMSFHIIFNLYVRHIQ